MSAPVNHSKARKAHAKAEKGRQADANAAKFGRTNAQREVEAAEARKMRQAFDQHRREE